jgi:hypothetical protein
MLGCKFISVTMFLCLFATITLAEKPAGLVGEWNFDEAQGDVIRDTSGIGKGDGKFINGQRIKQADGFALEMNGSTTYADCGSSEARGITSPVSIEGWIKPTRKAFGEASLFGTAMQGYVLTYYNTDIVLFYIGSGGNNVRGPVTVDQWNHVLATFDGERMRIWVNGRKTGDRLIRCAFTTARLNTKKQSPTSKPKQETTALTPPGLSASK